MKNRIFIFSLLFAFQITFGQFEEVKSFQKKLISNEITGSNVAMVYKDGKVVYHHIENSLDSKGKSIYNNSIFPVWSMTKPITIVAMMALKEKRLLDFDDKVSKYIPEFKNLKCKDDSGKIYDCKNEVTLYHLMTHQSGYKYYGKLVYYTSTVKYDNLKDFASDVAKQPLEFEPGTDYIYGINMAILGRVIEVVTNQTFYAYLKSEIFDPLGMKDTKFHLTQTERRLFQPLYINNGSIKGYTNDMDELSYEIDNKAYFGGEGLVSTMSDYSKFCMMLVHDGRFNGKQIITEKSIEEMTQSHVKSPENPFDDGYSMFVLRDPEMDGTNSSKGIFGWSGYHNTHFWIDREKDLFGLFMTRAREFSFGIQKEFRKVIYSKE